MMFLITLGYTMIILGGILGIFSIFIRKPDANN